MVLEHRASRLGAWRRESVKFVIGKYKDGYFGISAAASLSSLTPLERKIQRGMRWKIVMALASRLGGLAVSTAATRKIGSNPCVLAMSPAYLCRSRTGSSRSGTKRRC